MIRELCGVKKGIDERIDKGMFWWLSYMMRMEREIGLLRESM